MSETDAEVGVTLELASRVHGRQDGVFLQQVEELRRDLTAQGLKVASDAQPGTKGAVELASTLDVVIAGGAGMTTLCGVVALWLRQRGDRLVRMTVRAADGTERSVEMEGKNISEAALLRFAQGAAKQVK